MPDAPPKPPTLVLLLLGGLFAVGGLVLLGLGVPGVIGASADASLIPTEGRVGDVSSYRRKLWVTGTGPNRSTHENVIVVAYSYAVDGKRYSGRRYAFDEPDEAITDDAEAQARIESVRAADAIKVLYDPADPSQAVLARREMAPAVVVSVLGTVLMILGPGLMVGWWRARRSYHRLKAIHEGTAEWSPP